MSKIVFVAVSKDWDPAGVVQVLTDAGLVADDVMEDAEGGVDIYKQTEEIPTNAKLVQVGDGVVIGVVTDTESVKKYDSCSSIWTGKETAFSVALGKCGAVPMVNIAKDVLAGVVAESMRSARTNDEAKTLVTKAAEEFTAYVGSVIDMMPVEAFKLDVAFNSFEDDVVDDDDFVDDENPEAEAAEGAEPVTKSEDGDTGTEQLLSDISRQLKGLPALIDERVAAGIADLSQKVEGVAKSADAAKSTAEKTDKVLKSVTVGGRTDTDGGQRPQVNGGDDNFAFDTAHGPI